MEGTIDEKLKAQGYRCIATYDRSELLDRIASEIPNLQEMDYFIVPVDFALGEEPLGSPAYDYLHRIYVKDG